MIQDAGAPALNNLSHFPIHADILIIELTECNWDFSPVFMGGSLLCSKKANSVLTERKRKMIESIIMSIILGKLLGLIIYGGFFVFIGTLIKTIGTIAIENWPYTILFILGCGLLNKYKYAIVYFVLYVVVSIPFQILEWIWKSWLFTPIRMVLSATVKTVNFIFETVIRFFCFFF